MRRALILAALAQETRLDLLRLLMAEGPNGLPAGEIAARLGHSVEMLHRHYLLRPRGGQEEANEMILAYLDKAS